MLSLLILGAALLRLLIGSVVGPLGRSRHGLLLASRRTIVADTVIAAAVLIDLRIGAIDVAVNDFVTRSGAIVAAWGIAVASVVSIVSRVSGCIILASVVSRVSGCVAAAPVVAVIHAVSAVVVCLDVVVIDVSVDRVVAV